MGVEESGSVVVLCIGGIVAIDCEPLQVPVIAVVRLIDRFYRRTLVLRYQTKQIRGLYLLAMCCTSAAQAASFDAAALAAFVGPSASVSYTSADTLGTTLTVIESASSSMPGSDLFGQEGLWLGEDNTASWDGNNLQPLGALAFQGFVINRLDYTLAVVQAPTSAQLMGLGLLEMSEVRHQRPRSVAGAKS